MIRYPYGLEAAGIVFKNAPIFEIGIILATISAVAAAIALYDMKIFKLMVGKNE